MIEERWTVPGEWSWISVDNIAEVVGGGTPSTRDPENFCSDGIAWLTPADLTDYDDTYISKGARDLTDQGLASSSAKLMPAGAVLFSSRAPIGYCVVAANKISTNQGFKSLVLQGGIAPEFTRLYLLSSKKYIESKASGTTFKEISGSRVKQLAFPLPPLAEQRRIIEKLEQLSARTRSAKEHLDKVQNLATRAKQATLDAVFRNKIKDNEVVPIAEAIEDGLIGLVRSKAQQSCSGIPYIRMNHYDLNGVWNEKDLTCVEITEAEMSRYELKSRDLLFNTRNSLELVGKVALWPEDRPGHVYNNNILRVRFVDEVLPEFAFFYMMSPPFREYLESVKSATTSVAAIYQKSLLKAPFIIPPFDEQAKIVRRFEAAFARIDKMVKDASRAAELLERLEQQLLAKAFRGELVPQDPNDEPASVLLERIKTERAKAPKAKRRRKAKK